MKTEEEIKAHNELRKAAILEQFTQQPKGIQKSEEGESEEGGGKPFDDKEDESKGREEDEDQEENTDEEEEPEPTME